MLTAVIKVQADEVDWPDLTNPNVDPVAFNLTGITVPLNVDASQAPLIPLAWARTLVLTFNEANNRIDLAVEDIYGDRHRFCVGIAANDDLVSTAWQEYA